MANPEDLKPVIPKPVVPRPALPTEQSGNAPPVVLDSNLPGMEKLGAVKTILKNPNLPLMGVGAPVSTGGPGLMAAVPPERPVPAPLRGTPQEPKGGPPVTVPAEGYVRVEIHVENGQLSMTGIKEVAGPLINPTTVIRGYVYEVLIGDQQIAVGSIPDTGSRRAFANRDVPGPQGKHYFVNVPTFDFFARIPRNKLVTANLPNLNVVLHNVKEAPDHFTTSAPLKNQPGVETTEIGRLGGIKLDGLPQTVRPQLESILKENERLK